ncbi:hypothetical protein DESA109040_10440 [Deinococcus saxicola]
MCRVLEVSVSGYHSWRRRPVSNQQQRDALLEQRIREIHQLRKGRYGSPRIHAELCAEGIQVSRKRVARLMRAGGLRARGKRRWVRTTDSTHSFSVCPNLLDRQFDVQQPNEVWASDLTFVPTKEGWLYLAVTLDLYSRAVVGYAPWTHRCQPLCRSLPYRWLSSVAAQRPACFITAIEGVNMPVGFFRKSWPACGPKGA